MPIDISGFVFAVDNGLILIKAVIAGCGVADRGGDKIIRSAPEPEQFNRAVMPAAAAADGEIPISWPRTQPRAAPMEKEGTISPPRKPARMVSAVSSIFSRNVYHRA